MRRGGSLCPPELQGMAKHRPYHRKKCYLLGKDLSRARRSLTLFVDVTIHNASVGKSLSLKVVV